MNNKKGFTMVELLVVLVIVAILAAVATPIYLANVQRSRASEAVGTMALIRQAERDFRINNNVYYDVTAGNIAHALPTSVGAGGAPTPATAGVTVDNDVTQYFSNAAFTVDAAPSDTNGASNLFVNPPVVDFLISVNGEIVANDGPNIKCSATELTACALKADEVVNYRLEMDNSGRTFVSYQAGAANTWTSY